MSKWTEWSVPNVAVAVSVRSTSPKSAVAATSTVTSTGSSSTAGATRVHRTTPSWVGDPDSTPSGNAATGS